jgi:hypothetical protein
MTTTEHPNAMTEAELIALSALANIEAVIMDGENKAREMNGYSPAWSAGCGYMEAGTALRDELHKRGLLP